MEKFYKERANIKKAALSLSELCGQQIISQNRAQSFIKEIINLIDLTLTPDEAIKIAEKLDRTYYSFVPKHVIICLSLKKFFNHLIQRHKKFAFYLIRSLAIEQKIKRSKFQQKHLIKKQQNNKTLDIFVLKKQKIKVKILFSYWNKKTLKNQHIKKKFIEIFNRKINWLFSKIFKDKVFKTETYRKKYAKFLEIAKLLTLGALEKYFHIFLRLAKLKNKINNENIMNKCFSNIANQMHQKIFNKPLASFNIAKEKIIKRAIMSIKKLSKNHKYIKKSVMLVFKSNLIFENKLLSTDIIFGVLSKKFFALKQHFLNQLKISNKKSKKIRLIQNLLLKKLKRLISNRITKKLSVSFK